MRAIWIVGAACVVACSSSSNGSGGASGDDSPGNDAGITVGGPVPLVNGCAIFPADNSWNTRIDDTTKFPVHPQWAAYQTTMNLTTHLHPDWGDWSTDHYGIPWQTVPASQAGVPMTFQYADQSDPGPYPFPSTA